MATILGANSRCFLITEETGAYSNKHIKTLRKYFIEKVKTIESDFVVEKTPSHVFNINKMQEDFPDAFFIIMTRNPIDSIASTFKIHKNFNRSIYECSNDLSGCINAIKYKNAVLISYEKLVKDFDKTIINLCEFLEISFEKSMINFHETAPTWFEKFIDSDELFKRRSLQMKTPLFDGTGKGIKELSEDQIKQINFDCMDKYLLLLDNQLTVV